MHHMIEVTVESFQDYKLLGEVGRLTPKIPIQTCLHIMKTKRFTASSGAGGKVFVTFEINGMTKEDELYIKLKYNTHIQND